MPLRHRHAYAAGIQRGLLIDDQIGPEFPARVLRVRVATQPRSVRFELVGGLRSVQSLVSHVHRPVSLAEPDPSDGPDVVPALSGLLATQPLRSERTGCPQLHQPAATGWRRCPFITAWFTAPRGAPGLPPSGPARSAC